MRKRRSLVRRVPRDIHFLHFTVWGKSVPICGIKATEEPEKATCPECFRIASLKMRAFNRALGKRGRKKKVTK